MRATVRSLPVAALAVLAMALTACGSSGGRSSASSPAGGDTGARQPAGGNASLAPAKGSGAVNVLYAGSLVTLMEKQLGPGFDRATGYSFTGFSAGSSALATQIKGKVHKGDVFVSASPSVNDTLKGAGNGNWVSWYATYSSSPLVLGYNAKSKFAADVKSKPWYQVLTESGVRLGRTDAETDPKGKLTAQALTDTAKSRNLPALGTTASTTSNVFPEETLVGRLQSGQLDVGFFYRSEAVAAHIPTVPLAGVNLKATYTVTVLNNAPNEAGAEAFVAYLLGPNGQAALNKDGFDRVTPPQVTGTGVPPGLASVLPGA
jgi:molybdate/tungstate transport system substrate-binding protein